MTLHICLELDYGKHGGLHRGQEAQFLSLCTEMVVCTGRDDSKDWPSPWQAWSKVDPCIVWIIGPVDRPGIGHSQSNQAWGTTYCLGSWRGSGMEHDIHLENFTEPDPTFSDLSGLESVTAYLDFLHCPRFLPWSLFHLHLLARGPHLTPPTKPSPRGVTLLRSCSPPHLYCLQWARDHGTCEYLQELCLGAT